jgi:hypothetical protein
MIKNYLKTVIVFSFLFSITLYSAIPATPVGTAFTYQGRLDVSGNPATGNYDIRFELFDVATEGNSVGEQIWKYNIPIEDGLFSVDVDFGTGIFNGDTRWLEFWVKTAGSSGRPLIMKPRQRIRPAPYALGISLPCSETASSSSALFELKQKGTHRCATFKIDNSSNPHIAVMGETNGSGTGVYGFNHGTGTAILGASTGTGKAGYFYVNNPNNTSTALHAETNGKGNALYAESSGTNHTISAVNHGTGRTALFLSDNPANNWTAMHVGSNSPGNTVYIENTDKGLSSHALAVKGSGANWTALIDGSLTVDYLSKAEGSFRIDHPLDPANKYLFHSFVESPDMMNVYNGNVVTDENCGATVELPEYFEVLNRDYRYQLCILGEKFARARISREIENNSFRIQTDKPNIKVSWQVTGIRQDAYARAHPIIPEVEKIGEEKGTYLHPKEHGKPGEMGLYEKTIYSKMREREAKALIKE